MPVTLLKPNPPCIFWVGATGTGKSALSLEMAEVFEAEIVNADSIQMYRGLDVGSAKPSPHDFQRRPHFLFDILDYPAVATAGEYHRMFFRHMEDAENRKAGPQFVVGGTGFYFQAIEKGLLPVPKTDPILQRQIQAEVDEEGGEARLHAELSKADPEAARRIHPHDHYRLVRALEILRSTGRSLSEALSAHREGGPPFPYPLLKVGLRMDKDELVSRIEIRTRQMLRQGLIEEVRGLLEKGQGEWDPLRSVGYRECLQFLRGEIRSEMELQARIVQETMRLAKKQKTWFQKDGGIHWFHPSELSQVQELLHRFLCERL